MWQHPACLAYRISQVARLLGVSDDTVRRWTDSGRFPVTGVMAQVDMVAGPFGSCP
jgi:hypothetical protein